MRMALVGGAAIAATALLACPTLTPLEDAGSEVPLEVACATLVSQTCGTSMECGYELACEAARYLAEQDTVGSRCQEVLNDEARYPVCAAGIRVELTADGALDDCTVLVDVVCGEAGERGERACAQSPSCVNAALLANPSASPLDAGEWVADEQRQARCAAAINEKALYPPCRP